MRRQDIYPGIWDEEEEDLDFFHELNELVSAAAQSGQGLLVAIGSMLTAPPYQVYGWRRTSRIFATSPIAKRIPSRPKASGVPIC